MIKPLTVARMRQFLILNFIREIKNSNSMMTNFPEPVCAQDIRSRLAINVGIEYF